MITHDIFRLQAVENREGSVELNHADAERGMDRVAEVHGRDTQHAYARGARIVACVNACEGIEDPSVVPEMVSILKWARDALADSVRSRSALDHSTGYRELLTALARAEGKKC